MVNPCVCEWMFGGRGGDQTTLSGYIDREIGRTPASRWISWRGVDSKPVSARGSRRRLGGFGRGGRWNFNGSENFSAFGHAEKFVSQVVAQEFAAKLRRGFAASFAFGGAVGSGEGERAVKKGASFAGGHIDWAQAIGSGKVRVGSPEAKTKKGVDVVVFGAVENGVVGGGQSLGKGQAGVNPVRVGQ